MEINIAKASKPIALSLCMIAWLLAGSAHAASSHLYPAVGCQETYNDPGALVDRNDGGLQSGYEISVTCPIVTDANSMRITVNVFYETTLYASPTYAGKPFVFSCVLEGYDPAKPGHNWDVKTVHPNVRNYQTVGGSFTLSIEASQRFTHLDCILPGTKPPLLFQVMGYQVDES
jgi:hypothetical protein